MSAQKVKCIDCSKELSDYRSTRCRSCSKKGSNNPFYGAFGELNPHFKGGYIHKTLGYRFISHQGEKLAEHRVVAKAPKGYVVHHIDGKKTNNDPNNLLVMTQSEHMKLHLRQRDWLNR